MNNGGDLASQESCRRIDGYLSSWVLGSCGIVIGQSGLSFCQEVRLKGEEGEVRDEPVKEVRS